MDCPAILTICAHVILLLKLKLETCIYWPNNNLKA